MSDTDLQPAKVPDMSRSRWINVSLTRAQGKRVDNPVMKRA
jgi:hypothetical protein